MQVSGKSRAEKIQKIEKDDPVPLYLMRKIQTRTTNRGISS
jgi:hypothetical protein